MLLGGTSGALLVAAPPRPASGLPFGLGGGGIRTAAEEAAGAAARAAGPGFRGVAGKSGAPFALAVPESWVQSIDRPASDGPERPAGSTLAVVGDYTVVDTVAVRRERLPADAAELFAPGADPNKVADALTAAERGAVSEGEAVSVVGGVDNGRSGTVRFDLLGAQAVPGGVRFEYETEVCRGRVEEGAGGELVCTGLGNGGLPVDTVQRHFLLVVVPAGDYMYVLKASALASRWDDIRPTMALVADSFRVL